MATSSPFHNIFVSTQPVGAGWQKPSTCSLPLRIENRNMDPESVDIPSADAARMGTDVRDVFIATGGVDFSITVGVSDTATGSFSTMERADYTCCEASFPSDRESDDSPSYGPEMRYGAKYALPPGHSVTLKVSPAERPENTGRWYRVSVVFRTSAGDVGWFTTESRLILSRINNQKAEGGIHKVLIGTPVRRARECGQQWVNLTPTPAPPLQTLELAALLWEASQSAKVRSASSQKAGKRPRSSNNKRRPSDESSDADDPDEPPAVTTLFKRVIRSTSACSAVHNGSAPAAPLPAGTAAVRKLRAAPSQSPPASARLSLRRHQGRHATAAGVTATAEHTDLSAAIQLDRNSAEVGSFSKASSHGCSPVSDDSFPHTSGGSSSGSDSSDLGSPFMTEDEPSEFSRMADQPLPPELRISHSDALLEHNSKLCFQQLQGELPLPPEAPPPLERSLTFEALAAAGGGMWAVPTSYQPQSDSSATRSRQLLHSPSRSLARRDSTGSINSTDSFYGDLLPPLSNAGLSRFYK